jgi:dolichol-phosphate mannosyltransferase
MYFNYNISKGFVMKDKRKVVVVAPTYNEKGSVEKLVPLVLAQEGKVSGYEIHILIVDSHSPDGTGDVAEALAKKNPKVHFLDVRERGLGLAIIKGYEYALNKLNADVLMQIDADLQHDPNEIPLFLKKIDNGYDYVQGSRFIKGGKNEISLIRGIFSWGQAFTCRLLTGIWQITDFGPSYKAYTKQLWEKMDIKSIPYQGTTFLIQPAAVVEASRAGAKMTEVPIHFRKRGADKSKNEVANYIIDIIGYGLEVRLSKYGIKLPVLYWARRSKTFIKFGTVGFFGTLIDFIFYNIFISSFGFPPATSKGISTEIAILNNFTFNNLWTFKRRKTRTTMWTKLLIFNIVSLGGLAIGVLIVKMLHIFYGDGYWNVVGLEVPFYNLYFFATIPPVMIWNFLMNHYFTWKNETD